MPAGTARNHHGTRQSPRFTCPKLCPLQPPPPSHQRSRGRQVGQRRLHLQRWEHGSPGRGKPDRTAGSAESLNHLTELSSSRHRPSTSTAQTAPAHRHRQQRRRPDTREKMRRWRGRSWRSLTYTSCTTASAFAAGERHAAVACLGTFLTKHSTGRRSQRSSPWPFKAPSVGSFPRQTKPRHRHPRNRRPRSAREDLPTSPTPFRFSI